jgi:hypothetical protein
VAPEDRSDLAAGALPGARAVHDAVRVAVATTVGLLTRRYAVADLQTAIFGALALIGLLGAR